MSKPPVRARYGPALWVACALLCCWPLAGLLPSAWALENGVVENLQVAVLAFGGLCAAWQARHAATRADALLAACMVPLWMLLAGRELSWGAAFLAPTGDVHGVALYSSRYLWYKPAVAPLATLAVLVVAATMWRHRLWRHAWRLVRRHPALAPLLLLAALSAASAECAEGHLGCALPLLPMRAMALEELWELVAYVGVVAAQWMALRAPPRTVPTTAAVTATARAR